uniref:Large ribosomal subunit protein bL32c n=1 Tax=Pseudochorda nagaii TaxID=74379 RepID=A0A8F0F7V6_9PHAE|nr:ribosomal protein L32 [Pseudochorda nagaii]
MAVPKKRRSKSKGRTRLANWKSKGRTSAEKALNLAKSIIKERSKFLFDPKKKKTEEEETNQVRLDQNKEDDSNPTIEKSDENKIEE